MTSTQKDKLQLNDDLMFSLNFKRRGSIPDNLIVFVFVFDKYEMRLSLSLINTTIRLSLSFSLINMTMRGCQFLMRLVPSCLIDRQD